MSEIYKPHWKGPVPVPDIEVYARPRGNMQWSCPDCGYLHTREVQFWRLARVQCKQNLCKHKFRVGLGFTKTDGVERCIFAGKWQGNLANRLGASFNAYHLPMLGRVYGPIDFECPTCHVIQTATVDFHDGRAVCTSCTSEWCVQLLIYRPSGPKNIVPFDWAVFLPKDYVQTSSESLPVAPSDSRPGTSSDSPRDNCENPN